MGTIPVLLYCVSSRTFTSALCAGLPVVGTVNCSIVPFVALTLATMPSTYTQRFDGTLPKPVPCRNACPPSTNGIGAAAVIVRPELGGGGGGGGGGVLGATTRTYAPPRTPSTLA